MSSLKFFSTIVNYAFTAKNVIHFFKAYNSETREFKDVPNEARKTYDMRKVML